MRNSLYRFAEFQMEAGKADFKWEQMARRIEHTRPNLIIFDITPETPKKLFKAATLSAKNTDSMMLMVISQQYAIVKREKASSLYRFADVVAIMSDGSAKGVDCSFVFHKKRMKQFLGFKGLRLRLL